MAGVFALLAWSASQAMAQRSGTSSLVVQVAPEARLAPQQVLLSFQISSDGTSNVTTASAAVTAWVRAAPGQAIRVRASLEDLAGPSGPVSASAVGWRGSAVSAAGGGRQAACSSGAFAPGAAQDLVLGWEAPGTLTCSVSFELNGVSGLRPGVYSGVVRLAVVIE